MVHSVLMSLEVKGRRETGLMLESWGVVSWSFIKIGKNLKNLVYIGHYSSGVRGCENY